MKAMISAFDFLDEVFPDSERFNEAINALASIIMEGIDLCGAENCDVSEIEVDADNLVFYVLHDSGSAPKFEFSADLDKIGLVSHLSIGECYENTNPHSYRFMTRVDALLFVSDKTAFREFINQVHETE